MSGHGTHYQPNICRRCGDDLPCVCDSPWPSATTAHCDLCDGCFLAKTPGQCVRCGIPWDANPAHYTKDKKGRAILKVAQLPMFPTKRRVA